MVTAEDAKPFASDRQEVTDVDRRWMEEAIKALRTAARRGAPEGPLHKLADSYVDRLSVALRYAFARARIKLGQPGPFDIDAVVKTLGRALEAVLPKMLGKVMVEGGETAADMLELKAAEGFRTAKKDDTPRRVKIQIRFDGTNPRASEWAREHAAWLIDNITQTSREKIQAAVADVLSGKIDWDEQWERIKNAVGDDERATLIAKTETMTAVHAGQREAWDQAVEEGMLPPDVQRTWITVGDDKVCPECDALDGEVADLDGKYPGDIDQPPAHPACRCSEGLV